jgi:hypothetical protein
VDWPASAVEVTRDELRDTDVDVVVLQRPEELTHLAEAWLGRRPGRDIPAVYLEHNTPQGRIAEMRHRQPTSRTSRSSTSPTSTSCSGTAAARRRR